MISVYVQPGILPLLWVGVAGWTGTNLCFLLSSLACLPGYSFSPRDFCCPTWILRCGEEYPLLHCHVTVCRQDTAERIGQQPLPSGTWRPLKHLEMVTNGMKSPLLFSPCDRGKCWHQHCFLHRTAYCLQASHSLACFKLLLSLPSIPMGCRTDFCRMITVFKI